MRSPINIKDIDRIIIAVLFLVTFIAAINLPVNPWPRDGWYKTQYKLFEINSGRDNYTPIAAPALFYELAHVSAESIGLGLEGEFYLASILQNILILLSVCCVFYACKGLGLNKTAPIVSITLLLFLLSTGLPQAFWSENVVLFLTSWLFLLAVRLQTYQAAAVRFWSMVALMGIIIGLLVITRVTPIFLIPGLTFFLYRSLPLKRLAGFALITTLITALMTIGMMASNQYRFGRFEMTNSTGRHLWQGIRPIADLALAGSPEYHRLKSLDPEIHGKSWWEIDIVKDGLTSQHREETLKKLSIEAIVNKPFLWLKLGASKFVSTIGKTPYRLGYGLKDNHWNPLDRETFLPALLEVFFGANLMISRAIRTMLTLVYNISRWLYPFSLFFILASFIAMGLHRINACLKQRKYYLGVDAQKKVYSVLFFVLCMPVVYLAIAGPNRLLDKLAVMVLCLSTLLILSIIFIQGIDKEFPAYKPGPDHLPAYLFLVLIYFGTLWFSWQIEIANARNALPYLPFWAVMLAMGLLFWVDRFHFIRRPLPWERPFFRKSPPKTPKPS